MYVDIKNYIRSCCTCLHFHQIQPREKIIHHNLPGKPWEVIRADMFTLSNKNYLCIVDYHSKFPIIKMVDGMSPESLILASKAILSEYGSPKDNVWCKWHFISGTFRQIFKCMNIEQVTSSYHHKSNGHLEACIKFVKCTMKTCIKTNGDIHIALLQVRATPLESGLPSPAMLLFNCPIQGIMPILNRIPISSDNDDNHYEVLVKRQIRNDKNYDTARNYDLFSIESTLVVQQEDGGAWTHGTIVGTDNHSHINRSYTIRITRMGYIITSNSKHIKTTPITAEQYLRDQLMQHMNDPVHKIIKQYKKLSTDKVQSNTNNKRRGET